MGKSNFLSSDQEVPLRVICIGAGKDGRTFLYGGTMPIRNGSFSLEAGQSFWMDESAKGQKFIVASHPLLGDPEILFLYKENDTIAKLPIWRPGSSGTPAGEATNTTDLSSRYKWTTPTVSGGFILDTPGSKNITYKVNEGQKATYAGLTFRETITASILKDGTLLITKEGVIATDKNGKQWKSQKTSIDGQEVIAFFPAGDTR